MSSYKRSWAFESPQKLLRLLNDDAIWNRAALEHDAEITLLTAIAHAAIVAPIEAAEPERSRQHAGDMNRSDDEVSRLKRWLGERIIPPKTEEIGGGLFATIRHGILEDKDVLNDRGRCVDLWLPPEDIATFRPLTQLDPSWKRRTLYRQMRNALSHSMVFMRGDPTINEVVLCPRAVNKENETRRTIDRNERCRYQEDKKRYEEWKANRHRDPTGGTEEMEKPTTPAPLLLECDCLVFPIDTFKALLRDWLEFFDRYGEDLGVLTGRDIFDDHDDDLEAA